ncbi:MAG: M20/M25/M40 family metallo-hydrolase [Phycisphaeraceae bacterium]|nr:M28 family metallopeptidase [Phycisphaerales bacterium]MCB9861320.1 M20/M25/M40 family metallo-hydrolase [Phycisphaeraceae bacterium]
MPHARITSLFAVVIGGFAMPTLAQEAPVETVARINRQISAERLMSTINSLVGFGTRHTLSNTESDTRGIGAARRWVHDQFTSYGGRLEPAFDPHQAPPSRRIPDGAEVVNVIATLPGTMPEAKDRYYYILGHLDSRASDAMDAESDAPGANDDASGVAALMELARVLANVPLDATIVFMATTGEEQGLIGARMHAEAARKANRNIAGVLNNDMIGTPVGPRGETSHNTIRVYSEGLPLDAVNSDSDRMGRAMQTIRSISSESDAPSRQLARFVAEVAKQHSLVIQPTLIHRPDRFLRGGDHTGFNEQGFTAIRIVDMWENYDHQHQDVRKEMVDGKEVQFGDLPEYVDADYLANTTRLNAAILIHLANAPSVPGNPRIVTAELSYDTLVRWEPSPEPDVAGYEVVWRDTTSNSWDNVLDVGKATEAEIKANKDMCFFGVRAYDIHGYRSPVGFATAARNE